MNVRVIIPAFNEQDALGKVLDEIPVDLVREIIVVDNASTDNTAQIAINLGVTLLKESRKGYGNACLKAIDYIASLDEPTDIVVFLDADYSDYPREMNQLLKPIVKDNYDLVIGSRALGDKERGSMTIYQVFGNWLATKLIGIFYHIKFTDLGPFRAIKFDKLILLSMQDKNYGWTVEMQIKAAKHKLRCVEVPADYRKRIGFSKVSGTLKGTILAGYKIIWTIFKYL